MGSIRAVALALSISITALHGEANSPTIQQRNSSDNGNIQRIFPVPAGNANAVFFWDGTTILPNLTLLGNGLTYSGGQLIVSKTDLALNNVDNTSDLNKPISNATQTALNLKFNSPTGTTAQYLRGDGSLASFPTAVSAFTNDSGYLTSINSLQVTTALGFTPYNSSNPSNYITTAGARSAISLTTTGTSGAATYNSSTGALNIPNYASGTGTVTSVGLSSTDFTVSGSPVTTSGSITANLATSGVSAGTYSGVTVTTKGIVTTGTTRSFNNTATKTLVTSPTGQGGTVIDASRDAAVTYSVSTSTTATIGGAASVTVYLEIATTNSATASDWTAIQTVSNGQTITLAVVLQSVQSNTLTVSGIVPAGYYMRVRYAVTGSAVANFVNGQEVKL